MDGVARRQTWGRAQRCSNVLRPLRLSLTEGLNLVFSTSHEPVSGQLSTTSDAVLKSVQLIKTLSLHRTAMVSGDKPSLDHLMRLLHQMTVPNTSSKKTMTLRLGHSAKQLALTWYSGTEAAALEKMIRTAGQVPADAPILLLDDVMSAVAISSALPSGLTFELETLPKPGALRAVAVIDPISTGFVLCYKLKERGYSVIAVWSDVTPDELKNFVDARFAISFDAVVQHRAGDVEGTRAELLGAAAELGVELHDVMVGCECGVLLGDLLSSAAGLRGNGTALSLIHI